VTKGRTVKCERVFGIPPWLSEIYIVYELPGTGKVGTWKI
jgi:hypothetical protein